jgi:RNA polymerase sigma-70 factor (ECF subfamily)
MTTTLIRRARFRQPTPEMQLLARAQRGDVEAFEKLTSGCVDRLFAVALRLVGNRAEAEDVVQETLLRAWRGLGGFRGRSSFFTWLYRIAVNEAKRSLEKGARRPELIDLADDQVQGRSSPSDGPARRAEHRELLAALDAALLALPLDHRTAVVLRDIEGLSTREAADIVGVGEAAFKSRLHQGRLKIRAALGDDSLVAADGRAAGPIRPLN